MHKQSTQVAFFEKSEHMLSKKYVPNQISKWPFKKKIHASNWKAENLQIWCDNAEYIKEPKSTIDRYCSSLLVQL